MSDAKELRIAKLWAALKRYGQHEPMCAAMVQDKCDCGLEAAIKEAKKEPT